MSTVRRCILIVVSTALLGGTGHTQEVKKRVDPKYPAILKQAGIEGEVHLKVRVDEQGKVANVEVVKSSREEFTNATMEAVRQWEFTPATDNGKPVTAEVTVPFKFTLGADSYVSGSEEVFQLKENVLKILRGEMTADVNSFIGPEAYIVVGNKMEHLKGLLADKRKSGMLVEGKSSTMEMSRLITDDSHTSAYLMLKTRPGAGKGHRFHTIVFMQSPAGEWKLVTWHVSQ